MPRQQSYINSRVLLPSLTKEISMRETIKLKLALLMSALLTGCYVVPERTVDGRIIYQSYPLPPIETLAPATGSGANRAGAASPSDLPVRLYPANDIAAGITSSTLPARK
jgi:hypothetical protein